MDLRKNLILSGLAIVVLATTQIALAQEPAQPPLITSSQESAAPKEGDLQWAWGELVNLDNQAQTITLKYLDYETDQEKELVLVIDGKTVFENIKDFNELKAKDTLSIDYLVGSDNQNIAKNISLEKTEDDAVSAPVPAAAEEPAVEPAPEEPVPAAAEEPAVEPAPQEPPAADTVTSDQAQ